MSLPQFGRWLMQCCRPHRTLARNTLVPLIWITLLATLADVFGATASTLEAQEPVQVIRQATLRTASGERQVQLPHTLEPGDFEPEGSRVYYRMNVHVQDKSMLRAIYIQKMSRSGRILLNDDDSGSCGRLLLQFTRCQHHPQFFRTPYADWKIGDNTIEVEIYATHRQSNGLSEVVIGPREVIYRQWFMPQYLLQVQTLEMLTWLTMAFGMLSLVVFAVLRRERMYLWFGLSCLIGGASKISLLVITPSLPIDIFDWTVFGSRFLFSCLFGLTYLAYFKRERNWHLWSLLSYSILVLAAIWSSGSSPKVVSVLYAPVLVMGFVLAIASLFWAWRSGTSGDKAMALSFALMPAAGVLDLARMSGASAFTGVYWLPYTSSITLALMGIGMIGRLALALRTTRDMSSILKTRINAREAELLRSHLQIVQMEQLKARTDERERLLRDMHDGFLSTLSLTRTALAFEQTSTKQARQLVTECIDDLRLMLETSSNDKGALAHVLADFFYRFDRRIAGMGIELSLDIQLEGMPLLDSATLLQVMRIVQEATNNAIRHSGARHLHIHTQWHESSRQLTLQVQDDGHGVEPSDAHEKRTGRGLSNMRTRAQAIKGVLTLSSTEEGCCLQLQLRVL